MLQVADMQTELELLQPQLVVAAAENEKMLVLIQRESKDVETTSEKVRGEEALANEQAAESQELKEECEADLAEAIPALNAALSALDTLKVALLHCQPLPVHKCDILMGVSEHPLPSAARNTPSLRQPRSNFVKHPLQNTENDCHQWLCDRFLVHKIRCQPGLRPDPVGELTELARLCSWF